MNNLMNNISSIIMKQDYIKCEFSNDDIKKQNYELPDYKNITFDDMDSSFENLENTINYINSQAEKKYKDYLYNSLPISFNKSYNDFINNYIIEELFDNITTLISSKIEIYIKYMQNKVTDEYNYYLLILFIKQC